MRKFFHVHAHIIQNPGSLEGEKIGIKNRKYTEMKKM